MDRKQLAGKKVLVLGAGITGHQVAVVLAGLGAQVLVSERGEPDHEQARSLDGAGVELEWGGHVRARAELGSFDLVVPSPGISPLGGFLAEVVSSGGRVVSELDIGMWLAEAPVVAVTGTNGKTTVCRLAEQIARRAGLSAYACGNLETKLVTAAVEHPGADVLIVEASSFALNFCRSFRPRVAVITNLAADHLDWHGTFESYRAAKARIAVRQGPEDLFLYPAVQPELAGLAPAGGPRVRAFDAADLEVDAPWLMLGRHFRRDAAAAAATMEVFGAGKEAVRDAILDFELDPHRLSLLGSLDGVRFYDDSVSANPHATLAALESLEPPVVLIAGGRPKAGLGPLADMAGRLRAVVAIGEAAQEIRQIFAGRDLIVSIAGSMQEAVGMAFEQARPGDSVLLSPACASWDMFDGYAHRGSVFAEECRRLGVRR